MKRFIIIGIVAVVALLNLTFALDSNGICNLPHSANGNGKMSCRAFIPSWSYNRGANTCVKFTYGGCGGNKNRFGSKGECERKCIKSSGRKTPRSKSI